MAARVTHAHFERYAQHRLEFVRNIAALAEREDYLEVRQAAQGRRRLPRPRCRVRRPRPFNTPAPPPVPTPLPHRTLQSLLDEDAFGALKALLHDRVPTVAQTAALAVGRMASFSVEVAEELAQCGILQELCASMRESVLPGHLKSGCFVLKAVCRHSAELCGEALGAGAAATLVHCLQQVDAGVREGAAQATASLAQHAPEQAAALLAAGAAAPLVEALREPEPSLRRAAAGALGELGKHDAAAAPL